MIIVQSTQSSLLTNTTPPLIGLVDPVQDSEEHHVDLVIVAEHSDGSDVVLPPVRLHLDSQWRRENGRGRKEPSSSSISLRVFLVSLLNGLKQKWMQQLNNK